jgi:putative DNA primase/helicase
VSTAEQMPYEIGVITGPDPASMSLVDYALAALAAGVTPHPAKQDGTKMPKPVPVIDRDGRPVYKPGTQEQAWGWKHKQTIRPSEDEVRKLFSRPGTTGLGIFTGPVSGGFQPLPEGFQGPPAPLSLEMIEWEDAERFEACRETAHAIGLGELFDRATNGYLSATPGGGRHLLIRSMVIAGNQKLAWRPATAEELAKNPKDTRKVIGETRGAGGWTVESPSYGTVHSSGRPYVLLQGGLSTIATVTVEERQILLNLIESFNEVPDDELPDRPPVRPYSGARFDPARNDYDGATGLDVIEAYNRSTTWDSLLRGAGWEHEHRSGQTDFWSRPGKTTPGHSASTNYGGADRLCVFSSATDYETVGNGKKAAVSKFAFYAQEYHGGDFKAAVRAASDMLGMRGKRSTPRPGPIADDDDGTGYFSPGDPDPTEAFEEAPDGPDEPPDDDTPPDEIASALDRLQDLEERSKADPGLPFQPETLGALALLQERAMDEYQRCRSALKAAGVPLRDLERALKQLRARSAGFRVVSGDQGEPPVRLAASMVPDAPSPRLIIPAPYFLRADATGAVRQGVNVVTGEAIQVETVIAHAPLLITARLRDAEEQTEAFRLSWRRPATGWQSKVVDRGTALDARKLVALADDGAPVTSTNAKDIVPYLDSLEAANHAQLPCARISSHLGWQGDNGADGFLVGRDLILPDGTVHEGLNLADLAPEDWKEDYIAFRGNAGGDEQIADGFHARGSLDGWKRAVRALAGHRRALLPFYGSFGAVLLEILKASNFITDLSHRTSTGKTTTLRAAASVWGNPDERSANSVVGSWDSTRVWVERASSVLHGLPLFLDDTKRAREPRVIAETLYAVANGRGRGRGNPKGLARTRAWRTILTSTGEAPATSFTQDGGTRTRVLSIRGAPFGTADDETRRAVDLLNLGVLNNYGHAGPAFVRWLMARRDEWPHLTEMFRILVERYAGEARNAEAGRLAQYAALISMTARLVHEALELPWEFDDPLAELWAELAAESEDAAGDLRALRDVVSWAYSHESDFRGREAYSDGGRERIPSTGWAGRWDNGESWEYLAFYPTVIDRVLRELKYEPEAILAGWQERGWLVPGDGRNRAKRMRIGGTVSRVYVIARAAIEEADA